MKKQKAYLTHNSILVTEETLNEFKRVVFSIPFDGPSTLRRPFHRNIAVFLQHLICVATCSRKNRKKARFKADNVWLSSVPLPEKLGKKKLPHVFKQPKDLPHTRALELLDNAGLIKIIRHSSTGHKCREFAVSKRLIRRLFGKKRNAYLSRTDRYTYLTNIFNKRKIMSFDALIELAISRGDKHIQAKHKQSRRDIPNPVFRGLITQVWGNLKPIEINLDNLLKYYEENRTSKNKLFIFNFLSHLAETGIKVVQYSPLIVSYRQSYKTARIGSRSFEIGTGFQSLPSKMKWASLACGYNYDIKSCQIEILRDELVSIGISDKSLKVLDTAFICQVLGVEESLVKEFRFSGVFNKGNVSLSFKSKTVRLLNQRLGKTQAKQVLLRWKAHLKPLKADLTQLVEHYLKQGKTNRYGLCVTNAAGQPFNCTYKNVKTAKEWHPDTKKRKLLAHMLQGFESKAVYDYVASHQEICALEHDGFVSYDMVDDWGHEYLRVVKKN